MKIQQKYLDKISQLTEMKTTYNKNNERLEFYPMEKDHFLIRKYINNGMTIYMMIFDLSGKYQKGSFTADERIFDMKDIDMDELTEDDLETLFE